MNEQQKNVLGADLEACSLDPMTGFYRDGCCNTGPGDVGTQWCLCALRWEEARQAGKAPRVKLQSTNLKTLEFVDLDALKSHGIDLN